MTIDDDSLNMLCQHWPSTGPIDEPATEQINFRPAAVDGYVWPGLTMENSISCGVLLIEAPGAVGKSAAAAALAVATGWPLVDAAKAQVGSYSLSGLIHDRLGYGHPFLADLTTGRTGLIVDALDEAQVRAGTQNFVEFLRNIAQLGRVSEPQTSPRIVLLARPDTGALIQTFFDLEHDNLDVARLNFFDRAGAELFIDARLKVLREAKPKEARYGTALRNKSKFDELRDRRLDELVAVVAGCSTADASSFWPNVQTFVGYAPVLSVLTEYMCVPNFEIALRDPSVLAAGGARDLLVRIVLDLLEREQDKFRNSATPALRARVGASEEWDDYESAYSVDEQMARIINLMRNTRSRIELPVGVPPSIRADYEQRADTFILDHPFLLNKEPLNAVFGDFILAKLATSQLLRAVFDTTNDPTIDEVGPFFYQFVGLLTSDGHAVPESMLYPLMQSHRQTIADQAGLAAYFQEGSSAHINFSGGILDVQDSLTEVSFEDVSGVLFFADSLSHAIVLTDSGVVLGRQGQVFTLGPRAVINAVEVVIEAEVLSVDASPFTKDDPRGVSVLRTGAMTIAGPLRVNCSFPEDLRVIEPEGWPQFAAHRASTGQNDYSFIEHSDYMNLRAVLRFFSRQAGSLPSIFADKLDQGIVKDNATRGLYLAELMRRAVIVREAEHYYLDTTKLATLGIDLNSVTSGEPSTSVLALINQLNQNK